MNKKLNLDAPVRSLITTILSTDCEQQGLFGRTEKNDRFFCDLLAVGFDFYDVLELFVNCNAVNEKSGYCIVKNIPEYKTVSLPSDKAVRKLIPHWTSSRYRTASIEDICLDLNEKIKSGSDGAFIYNSNLNTKDRKVYNDTYVLFIRNSEVYFFDINRKKTFKIGPYGQEENQ